MQQTNALAFTVSLPAHRLATTLGKLPTPMCLCHQEVQFGTGQRAVMLCNREGNHRSGNELAMWHRLSSLFTYSHREGDEHNAYRAFADSRG